MLGRKRSTAYAPAMLDKIDQRSKRSAMQFSVPRPRHRKPRALNRKENRNHIPNRISDRRIRHHRPISVPILPVIQNSAQHQQVNEIRQIRELHELIAPCGRKLLQPNCRMHPRQPMIESNQLRVLPTWQNHMHQRPQLLKTKYEEKVRVPVTPKMPESLSKRARSNSEFLDAGLRSTAPNICLRPAKRHNHAAHQRLNTEQPQWMPQIL